MNVMDVISNRRSVRSYGPREIPADVLAKLRQALRWAPSACNYQPWHFVFVHDEKLRKELGNSCGDQTWIAQAPVIVVACGLPEKAFPTMGGYFNTAHIDTTIAIDHLTLAAAGEGLGTCWIGAFDEPKIKGLLGIPAAARIVALIPVGYPAEANANRPIREDERKTEKEIISRDLYGAV